MVVDSGFSVDFSGDLMIVKACSNFFVAGLIFYNCLETELSSSWSSSL